MSVYITTHVWQHSKLKGTPLLLLLALADQANDEGVCWPGRANLAHKTRLSERTVENLLPKLYATGEVVVLQEPHGTNSRVYRVDAPPPPQRGPVRRGEKLSPHDHPGAKTTTARGEKSALGAKNPALGAKNPVSRGEDVFAQTVLTVKEPSLKPYEPSRARTREADQEISHWPTGYDGSIPVEQWNAQWQS